MSCNHFNKFVRVKPEIGGISPIGYLIKFACNGLTIIVGRDNKVGMFRKFTQLISMHELRLEGRLRLTYED